MSKIIGNTTATPNPRPDWNQKDSNKADFIKNKPTLGKMAEKNEVARTDLAADVQQSLSIADSFVDYGESIIALSIDGRTITYIKANGESGTIVTQDENTEYSLGTDTNTGLTKLYATVGSAEDGTMTQKAIKTELDKKVGVEIDDENKRLIFTK